VVLRRLWLWTRHCVLQVNSVTKVNLQPRRILSCHLHKLRISELILIHSINVKIIKMKIQNKKPGASSSVSTRLGAGRRRRSKMEPDTPLVSVRSGPSRRQRLVLLAVAALAGCVAVSTLLTTTWVGGSGGAGAGASAGALAAIRDVFTNDPEAVELISDSACDRNSLRGCSWWSGGNPMFMADWMSTNNMGEDKLFHLESRRRGTIVMNAFINGEWGEVILASPYFLDPEP